MFAPIEQDPTGPGHELSDRRGHQDLAGRRLGRHARPDVDDHAGDVGTAHLDLAGVQPGPQLEPDD